MNVYKKMLVKLFEEADGKDSKTVDFKELTKREGFYPSYKDIFKHLSQQGWITESGREGDVRLTHWGIKEGKKIQSGVPDGTLEIKRSVNKLAGEVKEFLVMTEELASDISDGNLKQVEEKFQIVNDAIKELRKII